MSSIRQPRPEVNVEVIDGGRKPRNTYHPYEYSSDMYYKQEKDNKKMIKLISGAMLIFFVVILLFSGYNQPYGRHPNMYDDDDHHYDDDHLHHPIHSRHDDRPLFTPQSFSTIIEGQTAHITSKVGTGICYTTNSEEPVCNNLGCRTGFYISGTSGRTYPIMKDTTIKAISCNTFRPIVTESTYKIEKPIEEIEFFPPDGSTLYSGMTVTIKSKHAKCICYTLSNIIPQCSPNNNGCTVGTYILGDLGSSIPIYNPTSIYAIGCSDSTSNVPNSQMKHANFFVANNNGNNNNNGGYNNNGGNNNNNNNNGGNNVGNNGNSNGLGHPPNTNFYMSSEIHNHLQQKEEDKNCSTGTFICPRGYVCDRSAAIIGHQYGCVRQSDAVEIILLKDTIYQKEKPDPLELGSNVSINYYNAVFAKLKDVKMSISIVGKGFYFPVDIPVSETENVTAYSKLGQFYVDKNGFIRDMLGFVLKTDTKLIDNQDCTGCENREYLLEIHRNGDMFFTEKGVGQKYKLDIRLKLAYIVNEQGLDFYNTYPFYIDCKEVVCTRPELDEMPIWYYVTTEKSGEPIYMYPYDDHAGYLRGSLAVGTEALYFGGSTPYNIK